MIKFVNGSLLQSNAYALVNTVNTVGVMGKGIALQFKDEFPHNFVVYREACRKQELNVGRLLVFKDLSMHLGERLIINFPTKTHWRLSSEYSYIKLGLSALARLMADEHISNIAIPALGCGNGGLDWKIVKEMIVKRLTSTNAVIEVYEPGQ